MTRILTQTVSDHQRWHEQLAAMVTGSIDEATASPLATTRRRAIELAFYRATLTKNVDLVALQCIADTHVPGLAEVEFANALIGKNPLAVGIAAPVASRPTDHGK